jgi:MFS family permease
MKIFAKRELDLLWPFYLEYFLSSVIFFAPAFIVIYLYHLSLSFSQIGVLLAVIPLAALIFEIPTGAIADLYGRKISVLIGYLLEGVCMLLLFFIKDYYGLLIIFSIWGFGQTFSSGSKDAWIVDLINKKDKKLTHNFFNKMQIFINLGLVISGILGAFLVAHYNLSIIWLMSALSYFVSIILLIFFTKEYHSKKPMKVRTSFKNIFSKSHDAISYGYKHHVLLPYFIATFLSMIVFSLNGTLTLTPFLKGFNFPDAYFGYLYSIMAFLAMLGPMASSKFLKKGKEKRFIMIAITLSAVVMSFIILAQSWVFALIIFAFVSFFIEMRTPASQVYFHRFIPSKMRATMGSVKAIIISVGGIIASVFTGYLVDSIGARYTLLLYVPLAILIVVVYSRIKKE